MGLPRCEPQVSKANDHLTFSFLIVANAMVQQSKKQQSSGEF
jgi:hypothetical protein